MPTQPRPNNKLKKLAFKIIGEPQNMQSKRTAEQKRLDEILTVQQTDRVK